MTVSDWFGGRPRTVGTDCVLDTVTFDRMPVAVAVQISATPRCVAARCTRLQVRPPPEIVSSWLFTPVVGPSDAASAMRTSPAAVVLKAGVVCVPAPSAKTVTCAAGPAGAGPVEMTSDTELPASALLPPVGFWLITDPDGPVGLDELVMAADALACVMLTTFGTVTEAGGVPLLTSTAAKFQRSVVGERSFRMTLPAAAVGLVRPCIHIVSPLAARYS